MHHVQKFYSSTERTVSLFFVQIVPAVQLCYVCCHNACPLFLSELFGPDEPMLCNRDEQFFTLYFVGATDWYHLMK